jgi:chitin synthase
MQFVVFMELIGTLALPAAITFTLYVVIIAIMGRPATMPLILLALILGLPAVLIVMTSRKIVYVGWMLIYLVSLPIWNFVLPTYAYWHFDDFSWGDTRKVEGVIKDKGHGGEGGEFDSSVISMKKWSEYEMERRINTAKENNLPVPRFAEHNHVLDIFKETEYYNDTKRRRYSNISGSSGAEPFTYADYKSNFAFNNGMSGSTMESPLGIIPVNNRGVQLSDNHASSNSKFNLEERMRPSDANMNTDDNQDWIQQSTHDNNWADPAPHHNYSRMRDDLSSHSKSE